MRHFLKTLPILLLVTLGLSASAHARGWSWFVSHIKAGSACSGARPTTYYGGGGRNADGSHFQAMGYSAASWDYPFGTVLKVTNSQNGESVDVVIKDRGPARWIYNLGIHLDLSHGAARAIHLGQNGRFESGYTCHSVVSLGAGEIVTMSFGKQRRRGKATSTAVSSDYMSRAGAGI